MKDERLFRDRVAVVCFFGILLCLCMMALCGRAHGQDFWHVKKNGIEYISPIWPVDQLPVQSISVAGPNPWYDITANGAVCNWNGSTGTDDTVAIQNLVNSISTSPGGGTIYVPAGKACRITAQITIPGQIIFRGEVANGGAFGSGSFIVMDYNEVTPTKGALNWTGNNFPTSGIGGGLQHLVLWKATGRTGGAAVSLTATDCNHRPGHMLFEDVRISGDGTWNYALYVDGTACATAGTQGIRDVTLIDFQPFQTSTRAFALLNAVHFYWYGATTSPTGGGNADIFIDGGGTALTNSTDILLSGSISGSLVLDHADRVRCAGCYVSGNITSTVNTTNSYFDGMNDSSSPGVTNGLAYSTNDPVATASQNATRVNALRAVSWICADALNTLPSSITAGDLCAARSAVTGLIWFGGNGNDLLFNATLGNFVFSSTNTTPSIRLGGSTSAFPELKRNGTAFNVRLADDSGDAPLTASTIAPSVHLNQNATNNFAGTVVVSASTTGSATFGLAYTSSPVCTITPVSDPTATGVYWVTATTTAVTATVKTSGTITFNYHCIGNPN